MPRKLVYKIVPDLNTATLKIIKDFVMQKIEHISSTKTVIYTQNFIITLEEKT